MEEEINAELLASVEKRIDDLRSWYDQYFMGTRKRAPEMEKTAVQYLIRRMSNQKIRNTRLAFQFQQIVSKFNSYNQFWNRQMQKLESGTHRRDVFRAKQAELNVAAPPAAPAPKAAAKSKPEGGQDIGKLYGEFISAREQCNQPTNISREKMAESIQKQLPALQERYKGKDVQFKVVVENGQAKLKATIK